MEENANLTEEQSEELLSDVLCFAEMFERLSPEAKSAMIEFLHQLKDEE